MKAGLEVHQQLDTTKLFCPCRSELSETILGTIVRTLRATEGEEHAVDPAAQFEAARGLRYRYQIVPSSCLIDLDEEPPRPINESAVDVALTVATMLNARILDEIEVMRKIVVDGSNTAGFQRTALVAVDGVLDVDGKRYTIPTIALEEDAARRVGGDGQELGYRLDRLGVPLVEIATGPEITSGPDARRLAEEIGAILRSTGKVRRGIGTIREDLNVSTEGGARVEIKGVQELRLIHRYAEIEVSRQQRLLEAARELSARGASVHLGEGVDVSDLLRAVASGPIHSTLARGGRVLAAVLNGFAGLLKPQDGGEERLGRELADQARATGLGGILHSDELPGFGVDTEWLGKLREFLEAGKDDAIVLVAAPDAERARVAIRRILVRAHAAIQGVPEETRDPLPDGHTRYSRPLPGRNRMYPETDVPPILVTAERLDRIRSSLPRSPGDTRRRLEEHFKLGREIAEQLQRSEDLERFEQLVALGRSPSATARVLTQDLPAAESSGPKGRALSEISISDLNALLSALEEDRLAKEAVPALLAEVSSGAKTMSDAVRERGLSSLTAEDLARLAERVVSNNTELVRTKGKEAFSPLMGDLMKEVRGRRDGQAVAKALRAALEKAIATEGNPR